MVLSLLNVRIILPIAFTSIKKQMKRDNTPEENTHRSMFSSTDMSGVSLKQQLKYVRITTRELTLMLWDSYRKYWIKQRRDRNAENK